MKAKLKDWFPKNSLAQKVVMLAGGTAFGQAVGVLAMPILSRLYSPEDFAVLSLFTSFAMVALTIVTLRYELAIPAPKDNHEATYLLLASILAASILSPLASIVLGLMISTNIFGLAVLPSWTPLLMGVYLWFGAAFFALRYWLIRMGSFSLLGQVTAIRGVMRALVQSMLGVFSLGAFGMLVGELVGQAAGIRQMLRHSASSIFELRRAKMGEIVEASRRSIQFPLYGIPSAFLDTTAQVMPLFLFTLLYGPTVAGFFALVQRAFALPLTLLGQSIADAFHNSLTLQYQRGLQGIKELFFQTAKNLLLIGLALGLGIVLLGWWVFPIVFGERWRPAGEMAMFMAPWFVAQLVVSPLSRLVFVLGGQQAKLIYDIVALLAILLAFLIARAFSISHWDFLKILTGFNVLAYSLYYVLLMRIVRRATSR